MLREEQEVVIGITEAETEWRIYSSSPRWTRFFTKFCDTVGGRIVQVPGGTKFFLPEGELRFAKPRRLSLTAEQRAVMSARGKANLANLRQNLEA